MVSNPESPNRIHVLVDELTAASARIDAMVDGPVWSLSDGGLLALLLDCSEVLTRLAAFRLQIVAEVHGRGLARRTGACDTVALLRERLRVRAVDANRLIDVAVAVDGPLAATGKRLVAGEISVEQAQVIVAAMRSLPAAVTGDVRRRAEAFLLRQADEFDPTALARLARHLRETLVWMDASPGDDAPDPARTGGSRGDDSARGEPGDGGVGSDGGGDGQLGGPDDAAAAGGEDPAGRRKLSISELPDGMTRISGELDPEAAALLRTALDPLAVPRPAVDGALDPRSPARRRADALVDLLTRTFDAAVLPVGGGVRPHLTVTIPWSTLRGRSGVPATTGWGQPLPREVLRRLACDSSVGRIILDPAGVPLDVGRTQRTVTADIRRALIARDHGCAFPTCDRPVGWTEAHHIRHWIDGGHTSLDNSVLLCGHHHRVIHHQGWTVRLGPDRRPEFLPPAWIDASRSPRRNPYSRHAHDLLYGIAAG
ncbi:HNH endonuclease [Frankia sp. AiPs1]|uniref:HNH endonuclease signature motif containing protein n=1 Tax=Frankia sp. AiPs1 TaxID=573493 RepID=UPI002044A7E9|nr:HNH endonuclease signature motif containing protein [Frankia sp. AiPs1]MCM3920792.1 HNH endonuclease [Frankia sp. AiPs1]